MKNNICNTLKSLVLNNYSLAYSAFLPKYSQLSCQQMDLYLDLIEKNKKNIEMVEKKQKYQDAINYCYNIIKLKQKLYGDNNKSQNDEMIKIAVLYIKLNDYDKALNHLHEILENLDAKEPLMIEIYLKKADIHWKANRIQESIKESKNAYFLQKKIIKETRKENLLREILNILKIAKSIFDITPKNENKNDLKALKRESLDYIKKFKENDEIYDGDFKNQIDNYEFFFQNN